MNSRNLKRNTAVAIGVTIGIIGGSGAHALEWSDAPTVVGGIIGGGVGSAVGSISGNPFIQGATSSAGAYVGTFVGPYVVDHPIESASITLVAVSGPVGWASYGVHALVSSAVDFVHNLFW